MPKSKYNKIAKNGVEYYRHTFTIDGHKYDVMAKTEKALEEKIDKIKYDIKSGDSVNSPNITVATWANEWLEVYKKPVVIDKSYRLYRTNINKYIIPAIGKMRLNDVQPVNLQKILSSQTGMSFSHVSHVKNAITGMFREAHKNGYINKNPAELLIMPATIKGTHRCITETEERYLLKVCETHYIGLWALLMYYCGLRGGECAALVWEDVDINKKIICVTKAVESDSDNIKITKTKSGIREVPIPNNFMQRLINEKQNKNSQSYVITNKQGNICTDRYLNKCWKNIIRHMNIEMGAKIYNNKIIEPLVAHDLTPYCLRHTYCTNLQRAGVPINVAKYLMGHNDIKMVANIYGHQTDDQTEAARDKINILLEGGEKR